MKTLSDLAVLLLTLLTLGAYTTYAGAWCASLLPFDSALRVVGLTIFGAVTLVFLTCVLYLSGVLLDNHGKEDE